MSHSNQTIRKLPASLGLLLLLLTLGGAQASAADDPSTFRLLVFEELNTLDPQKMSWLADIRIAQCLFEPLVVLKPSEWTIEGGAAQTWEVGDDGLTYTFHLRPQARWSNGDPVTAYDFVYAWRRTLLPDLAADYTQLFFCIQGAEAFFQWRAQQIERLSNQFKQTGPDPKAAQQAWNEAQDHFAKTVGIRAIDDHTLVVRLAQRTHYFLELCGFVTFSPVHRVSVDSQVSIDPETGALRQDTGWTKPDRLITNGPYTLKRWRFKRDLLLAASDTYWNRTAVANKAILQRYVPELQAALLLYQNDQADWIPDIPTARLIASDLVRSSRSDVHLFPAAGTYFYNFNCQEKLGDGSPNPLADARVRRALSMTIDRRTLVEKVTRLHQPVARTFVPPQTIPGYEPPSESGVAYDPTTAKQLLADAGHPNGAGIKGLSILYNTEGGHEAIAQQIKNNWQKQLGVEVTLEGVEKRIFSTRLKKHDFTICRASWFGDYRDPTTFLDKFINANGNNDAGYRNPKFDDLMTLAQNQSNPTKRLRIFRDAETLMLADQPIAVIYQYSLLELFRPDQITGLIPNPWNFRRLEFVRVKK